MNNFLSLLLDLAEAISLVVLVLAAAMGFFVLKSRRSASSSVAAAHSPERSITLAEVASHAGASDCWMVVEGKVYDVTKFIPSHPGGNSIVQGCGKDATSMFNSRPNDGTSHSDRARALLTQFQIGVLGN